MSNAAFLAVVTVLVASNVATVAILSKVLGDRLGDFAERLDRLESHSDGRHDVVMNTLSGMGTRS